MANAKPIILTDEDYEYLQSLTRQRTIQAQVVDRAKILIFEDAIPGISHENETDEMKNMVPDMARMYYLIATEDYIVLLSGRGVRP